MNDKCARFVHAMLALSDIALIVVIGLFVLQHYAWIFFPQVFNRVFEIITLYCLSNYRPLTFSVIQPMLTAIGALVEPNPQNLIEGYAPLLIWEVLILIYVRYSSVLCPPLPVATEAHVVEVIPTPQQRAVETLHVHRLLYIVIEQPDKSKSIAVKNAAPTVPMAA